MSMERTAKSPSNTSRSHIDNKQSVSTKEPARPFSADHILQMQNTIGNHAVQHMLSAQMKSASAPIQRMDLEEEELQMKSTGAPIQRMGLEEEELQMKKADATVQLKENDNKMPGHVQSKMEKSIGADFSDVNIHVGSEASNVGALAYAQGSDIHFAPGQYDPESTSGQALLGHELTHVQQQRQGRVKPTMQAKGIAVNDDAGLEREADIKGAKAAAAKQ